MNKSKLARIGILFIAILLLARIGFAAEEHHAIVTIKIGKGSGWDDNWGNNLLPNYYYTWDPETNKWWRTSHDPTTDTTPNTWKAGEEMSFGDFEDGSKYITHGIDGGGNDDGTVKYATAEVSAQGSAAWGSWSAESGELDDWDNSDKIQANADVRAAYYKRSNSIQQQAHPPTSESIFPVMSVRLRSASGTIDEWGDDLVHNSYYTWDQEQKAWYRTSHDPVADGTEYNWRQGEKLSGNNWANLEAGTNHIAFNVDGGGNDDGTVKYATAEVSAQGSAAWGSWSAESGELDDVYDATQTRTNADMKSAFYRKRGEVEQHSVAEIKAAETELQTASAGEPLSDVLIRQHNLEEGGTVTLDDGRLLTVDDRGNIIHLRNPNDLGLGDELEEGELEQLGLTPGQAGIKTLSDGRVIRVDVNGRIDAERPKEGFTRRGAINLVSVEASGTGIGAAPGEMVHYYDLISGDVFSIPEAEKAKTEGKTYLREISQEQLDAIKAGAANRGSFAYNEDSGKFSISYTSEEEGVAVTTTTLVGEGGLETKTEVRTAAGESITMVRDAKGNIQSVTGPDGQDLGKSSAWSINNQGKLTFKDAAVKEFDRSNNVAEMDDGRYITVLEDGTMELSADGQTVIIRIEGENDQKLTAQEYKDLTGLDPKEGVPSSARASIRNLKEVMAALKDALGREDIELSDLVGRDVHEGGTSYWTDGVKIDISADGKTVTSTATDINPDGSLKPGSDYEQTIKQDGRVTRVANGKITEGGDVGGATTSSEWIYGPGKDTGTATITTEASFLKNVDFKFDQRTGDIIWYEVGGKYYRVEDGTWFNDPEFTSECKTGCPDKDITGMLRDADDEKAAKEGRSTSTERKVQRFWGFLESAARGGIGRFFSLFMDEEDLEEWREDVDEVLCSTVIAGGIECWTSEICALWVDNRIGEGMVYAETPEGMLTLAAHIEGERTIVETPGGTEYLYKITYTVTNPEEGSIGFNVYLYGDRETPLYSDNIILEEGESHSRVGSSAVVQYSSNSYNKLCIIFTEEIDIAGDSTRQVCNSIGKYSGPAIGAVGEPLGLPVRENQV